MNILVVDSTTESQAALAGRVKAISAESLDQLEAVIKLAGTDAFLSKLNQTDVLIFGPGLAEEAITLIRVAADRDPNVHIMLLADQQHFGETLLKEAYASGAHKVLPFNSAPMDLYQEFLLVHSRNCKTGKHTQGKVVAVTSAKGGVGVTSLTAALAEVCNDYGKRTLLWDLDFESRDLSRALLAFDNRASIVNDWVTGRKVLKNKGSLMEALVPVADNAHLLVPPSGMAEGMDLSCHTEGIKIVSRVVELARLTHDVTFVDLSGITGPAKGAIIRLADKVLTLSGDCTFGYTSLHFYLAYLNNLLGDLSRLHIVRSSKKPLSELKPIIDPDRIFPESVWSLPIFENDDKAKDWQGTHKTLYSKGSPATRAALKDMALELGLVDNDSKEISSGPSKPSLKSLDRVKSLIGSNLGSAGFGILHRVRS